MATSFDRLILTQLDRVLAVLKHEATAIMVWWALFALIGAALVEGVGIIATGGAPDWPIHLAAVLAALVLGYVAAVTVACWAVARALTAVLCWVTVEAERAASKAIHEIVIDSRAYMQGVTYAASASPPPSPTIPLRARPESTRQFVMPLGPVVPAEARDVLN